MSHGPLLMQNKSPALCFYRRALRMTTPMLTALDCRYMEPSGNHGDEIYDQFGVSGSVSGHNRVRKPRWFR